MPITYKFSETTTHNGINMQLIGQWIDLAAYYRGSDGNAWLFHNSGHSWVNEGDCAEFIANFKQRRRGKLLASVELQPGLSRSLAECRSLAHDLVQSSPDGMDRLFECPICCKAWLIKAGTGEEIRLHGHTELRLAIAKSLQAR